MVDRYAIVFVWDGVDDDKAPDVIGPLGYDEADAYARDFATGPDSPAFYIVPLWSIADWDADTASAMESKRRVLGELS